MFISKKRHEEVVHDLTHQLTVAKNDYESIQTLVSRTAKELSEAKRLIEELTKENDSLKQKNSEYESGLAGHADRTQTTLYISEDLTTVTPVTKVNPNDINKMIERGYLPWNKRGDSFAVNLAALTIAQEALEQMVFSFEEALRADLEMTDVGYSDEEEPVNEQA